MFRYLKLLVCLFATATLVLSLPAAEPAPKTIKLGILSGMFRDVPPSLAKAAAMPFRELFKQQTGLDGEIAILDDSEMLATHLKEGKQQFGVFHSFEWAWVKNRYPEILPLVVTNPTKKLQACLIVKADSKIIAPIDLKGPSVSIPIGSKAFSYLFLERLQATLPANSCLIAQSGSLASDEVIDGVIEGTLQAGLVDAATLSAYESNRGPRFAQVRILAKSEIFPPSIIVYRRGSVEPELVENIRSGLIKAHTNSQGKAFLFLWKLKGFESVPSAYEGELQRIATAYPYQASGRTSSPK